MTYEPEWIIIHSDHEAKRTYVIGPFATDEHAYEWTLVNGITSDYIVTFMIDPSEVGWQEDSADNHAEEFWTKMAQIAEWNKKAQDKE